MESINSKLIKLLEMLVMEDLRVVHVFTVAIWLQEQIRRGVRLLEDFCHGTHLYKYFMINICNLR